jgi:SAM-dependent methyltransferase
MSAPENPLFALQRTLYESRNPTRRSLHVTRRDWIIDAIRRWGNGATKALEVGPGSGVYLPALASAAKHVVACDIEPAYLEPLPSLTRPHSNLQLVWDDIAHSSFDDGEFDLVLCSEVVEHIRDARPAFREMRRILSADGTLILSTPQKYSPLELTSKLAFLPGIVSLVRRIYREPILDPGHVNLMTNRELARQLRSAGFEPMEWHFAGLYIPLVAEALGQRGLRIESALERRIRGTRARSVLWTQFVVAQPCGSSATSLSPRRVKA